MTLIARTYWSGAPWMFRAAPESAEVDSRVLRTEDFREFRALYWTPRSTPRPRVAVVAMHPRVDFTHHYAFPALLSAGYGCLGCGSRNLNDDTDTVHEDLLLDLAAAVRFLRERRGVEKVVLLGNSGGGSLAAFYQAQSRAEPAARIAVTPGGEPTRLPAATMIPADALALIAAHPGQGRVLGACIDPSVSDERDPFATDDALDMYNPANGFRAPPEWSAYDPAFITRYREAQSARVARIDAIAEAHLAHARAAAERAGAATFSALPAREQQRVLRAKHFEPVMLVYRTMANLAYTDNAIHPSEREYGSLLSDRPDLMNWQRLGFARTVTPRAWLSTWSAHRSNAVLAQNLARVTDPLLLVHAGRDRDVFRDDAVAAFEASGSPDKTFVEMPRARHYFEPDFGETRAPDRDELLAKLCAWLAERVG